MIYRIILLKDGRNILISDEQPLRNYNNPMWNIVHNKIFNDMGVCLMQDFEKIIAGIDPLPTLTYSDEVKQILRDKYGWVDVEELANEEITYYNINHLIQDGKKLVMQEIMKSCFKNGFKEHQSITNKRFSLEDVHKAYDEGLIKYSNKSSGLSRKEFIQSLQQRIQLNVEIKEEQDSILITKILN